MLGQVSSTILTAVSLVLVARFLGSTSFGQITIAMIPISLASIFTNPGVNSALTKYLAQYRAENKRGDLKIFMTSGLLINLTASLALVVVINLSSGYLASTVFNQPEIRLLIQVASFNLIAQTFVNTTKSIFIGFERMEFVSLVVVVQSLLKSILAPLLVYFGMGALGAVLGNTSAHIISGLIGITIFVAVFLRKRTNQESQISHRAAMRVLLTYGFPLYLSILISGAISQVYNFLMAVNIDAFYIGNYSAAAAFTVLITFFIIPISTVLFPLFSKLDPNNIRRLGVVYQNSVKYAALISVPISSALILLADPIVRIVYGESFPLTAQYLQLMCLNYLFIGIGGSCSSKFLNGQGKTRTIFIGNIIRLLVVIPTGFYLIPRFGIPGLIITTLVTARSGLLYFLSAIKKNFGFSIDWKNSGKIYLSSLIPLILSYFVLQMASLNEWQTIILGGLSFGILYLSSILFLRVLEKQDIQNLRRIFGSMGPLTPFFNMFITILEKFVG
jgi:O-antigen/teichoic acid export membrane protein